MDRHVMQPYFDWFDNHVAQHKEKSSDSAPLMERKRRHTMRVLEHVRHIAAESGAEPELRDAMEIAALLHDVGRFPQLLLTSTCDPKPGYNHGKSGAALLEESDILNELPADLRDAVLCAVRYHNRDTLPHGLSPEAKLVLSVIRDGDKLDAIRNNLKHLTPDVAYGKAKKCGVQWSKTEVSPDVLALATDRNLIPLKAIRFSNDFYIFLCCWIYELGFHYSFAHLEESGLYEELLSRLPDTDQLSTLKTQLREDLHWISIRSKP